MNDLIFPIKETVRIRFEPDTGIIYMEWNIRELSMSDHWIGLIIPSDNLSTVVDALNKIEKLLVLK
jgi:hypothetical protein